MLHKVRTAAVVVLLVCSQIALPASVLLYLNAKAEQAHAACVQRRDQYDIIHRIIARVDAADPTDDLSGYYHDLGKRPDC